LPVHDDSVTPHTGALKFGAELPCDFNLLNLKEEEIGMGRADTPSSFST
jgi:hypothetical protein